MPSAKKIELEKNYSSHLEESPDFILTRFQGTNVAQLTEIRKKLKEKDIQYKVIKNNIFKLAAKKNAEIENLPIFAELTGPIGVAFPKKDTPSAAKILKKCSEDYENFQILSAVMEFQYYDKSGVEGIASLPSKEESLATLAAALNSPATQIAGMMNQIMSSLARAIKAIGEKNG
ncbi:MAG: 50S ribosomal protein L10 [Spirochaetia bacterium]|nr:50S ribosomal protein L10 [Spirochaetia bacterium]